MTHTPIESSNLRAIGYDSQIHTLEVKFKNGGLHQYASVPPQVHASLMSAESHGSYFSHAIKNVYRYLKLR